MIEIINSVKRVVLEEYIKVLESLFNQDPEMFLNVMFFMIVLVIILLIGIILNVRAIIDAKYRPHYRRR